MVAAWLQKLCDIKFGGQEGVLGIAHHGAVYPAVEGRTHCLKLQKYPDQGIGMVQSIQTSIEGS